MLHALTVSALFLILGYLVYNGGSSLDWNFFTKLPLPPGETGGGMANAIVGSVEIVGVAALIGLPVGFLAGIYLAEFEDKSFAPLVRYIGGPVERRALHRGRHSGLGAGGGPDEALFRLAGSIALSVMLIPIVTRQTEQFLREVPLSLREGALALGASKWKTIATVVVPAGSKGILTGMILGVARIAGESAPLLFTASTISSGAGA